MTKNDDGSYSENYWLQLVSQMEDAAQLMKNPETRDMLLQMAKMYMRLASRARSRINKK